MRQPLHALLICTLALTATVCGNAAPAAETYHVHPGGDDANDGRTSERPWKSVARVNRAVLRPGDHVLFARGGVWRESLKASSSGESGKPIVYAAYGSGAKPRFLGSDVLDNAAFRPVAAGTYRCACPQRVASVLADHRFLVAADRAGVEKRPNSWFWEDGTLLVHTGDADPRRDGRVYTVCVRVDCVHSNGKDHLVFRDLVGDESADARDGYCFRVMGSTDVRLVDCEAYRAGRHHFGAINSTQVVGERLYAAHAMPNLPGGATFFVSFSDAGRSGDTHQWLDCKAEHLEDPGQRSYQVFYNHGEGLGPILLRNLVSRGGMLSVGSSAKAPVTIKGGRIEDASLEVFGSHLRVDGLTMTGNGAVDNYGSDCLFENLRLVGIHPKNGGPTGYSAAVVLRKDARRNTLRFCTIVLDPAAPASSAAVALVGKGSATRLIGNILLGKGPVLKSWAGALDANDVALADWNFYGPGAKFAEQEKIVAWKEWQTRGFDAHSLTGDPLFVNAAAGDFTLKGGSPAAAAARVIDRDRPAADAAGKPRRGPACAIGAHEPVPDRPGQ